MADQEPNLSRFVEFGRKIIGVGRNYRSLLNQRGFAPYDEPVCFLKLPSCYITQGEKIKIPPGCDELIHEVELGVVIGKRAREVSKDAAMDYVGGYVTILDMTNKTYIWKAAKLGIAWGLQGKAFDSSLPVGKFVPKESVPDPHNLNLWCRVNGELKQNGNTNDLIFNIPYIISYISKFTTLEPGDLVLTGTPGGVTSVKPGDVIEACVEGIGTIKHEVEE